MEFTGVFWDLLEFTGINWDLLGFATDMKFVSALLVLFP